MKMKTEQIKIEELGIYARIRKETASGLWKFETTPIGLDGDPEESNWACPEAWAEYHDENKFFFSMKPSAECVLHFFAELPTYAQVNGLEIGELSDFNLHMNGNGWLLSIDSRTEEGASKYRNYGLPRLFQYKRGYAHGPAVITSKDPWDHHMTRLYNKFVVPDNDSGDWKGPVTAIVDPMLQADMQCSMGYHGSIVDSVTYDHSGKFTKVILKSKGYRAHGF
jgi:hypothetical protein